MIRDDIWARTTKSIAATTLPQASDMPKPAGESEGLENVGIFIQEEGGERRAHGGRTCRIYNVRITVRATLSCAAPPPGRRRSVC